MVIIRKITRRQFFAEKPADKRHHRRSRQDVIPHAQQREKARYSHLAIPWLDRTFSQHELVAPDAQPIHRCEAASRQTQATLLDNVQQQQNHKDQHDQAQSAAWIVSPAAAVGPCRKRADQQQDQKYHQNRHRSPSAFYKLLPKMRFFASEDARLRPPSLYFMSASSRA